MHLTTTGTCSMLAHKQSCAVSGMLNAGMQCTAMQRSQCTADSSAQGAVLGALAQTRL